MALWVLAERENPAPQEEKPMLKMWYRGAGLFGCDRMILRACLQPVQRERDSISSYGFFQGEGEGEVEGEFLNLPDVSFQDFNAGDNPPTMLLRKDTP